MTVENKRIFHISDDLTNLNAQQMGVQSTVDADLAFKMWGGKDDAGVLTTFLAKDKPARITTLKLTGGATSGELGILRHDAAGNVIGDQMTVATFNTYISDGALISNHNDLLLIDGGTSNEYFHLTAAAYDDVVTNMPWTAGGILYSDASNRLTVDTAVLFVDPATGFMGKSNATPAVGFHLGAAASTHALSSSNDGIITGNFEVDGIAYFDGSTVIMSSSTKLLNESLGTGVEDITLVTASGTYLGLSTFTDDGLHFGIGYGDGHANRNFIITDRANIAKDHDHLTLSANPTLFIHSVTDPDSVNTQWISLSHNQVNGNIQTGLGALALGAQVTSHALSSNGDIIAAKIEATGTAYFDNAVLISSTTNNYLGLYSYPDDGIHFAVGNDTAHANRNMIITDYANMTRNHDHSVLESNPVMYLHSATNPDTNNLQFIRFEHKVTHGQIQTGVGYLAIGVNTASYVTTNGDLLVNNLEVQASSWFSALATFGSTVFNSSAEFNATAAIQDDILLTFGDGDDVAIQWDTGQTNHALLVGLGASNSIIFCEKGDMATNFALSARSDPTLFMADATGAKFLEVYQDSSWATIYSSGTTLYLHSAGVVGFGSTADFNNHDLMDIKCATFTDEVTANFTTATITVDWNSGNVQKVTITANCTTVAFTAPTNGGAASLVLTVLASGGDRTITGFPANVVWAGEYDPDVAAVTIPSGTEATISLIWRGGTVYKASMTLDI